MRICLCFVESSDEKTFSTALQLDMQSPRNQSATAPLQFKNHPAHIFLHLLSLYLHKLHFRQYVYLKKKMKRRKKGKGEKLKIGCYEILLLDQKTSHSFLALLISFFFLFSSFLFLVHTKTIDFFLVLLLLYLSFYCAVQFRVLLLHPLLFSIIIYIFFVAFPSLFLSHFLIF